MKHTGLTNWRQLFWGILLPMAMLSSLAPAIVQAAGSLYVGHFSAANPDEPLPPEWKPLTFKNIASPTQYSLVKDGDTLVVKAVSKSSASGLIRKINIDPERYPLIRWRWKASNILTKGDVTKKEGDDYAARVYVTFEYNPERAGFFEKAMVELGRLIYGEPPPIATINYIWANKVPVGTIVQNPYTKLVKMIAVESGEVSLNQWVTVERNVFNDFVMAFGEKPPMISGVAVMTDSDNTKESVVAYYGDILFKQK